MADRELIERIRIGLREAAEPDRAAPMQAYMKSSMPYLGVPVPEVRRITNAAARVHSPASATALAATGRLLWRRAEFREERYAATALTGLKIAHGRLELLPLYEEMITVGAWWDHVDEVAHRIGILLIAHPDRMRPLLQRWAVDQDRWLRRTSIIAQLGVKRLTDIELLERMITANVGDPDRFIRKAIGWALRDYARTEPAWVRRFVDTHHGQLSALSRREALRHLDHPDVESSGGGPASGLPPNATGLDPAGTARGGAQ
ncbi:MAG: DNA alkylation repair protein [Candidatus Dormibacteria bacterium]